MATLSLWAVTPDCLLGLRIEKVENSFFTGALLVLCVFETHWSDNLQWTELWWYLSACDGGPLGAGGMSCSHGGLVTGCPPGPDTSCSPSAPRGPHRAKTADTSSPLTQHSALRHARYGSFDRGPKRTWPPLIQSWRWELNGGGWGGIGDVKSTKLAGFILTFGKFSGTVDCVPSSTPSCCFYAFVLGVGKTKVWENIIEKRVGGKKKFHKV